MENLEQDFTTTLLYEAGVPLLFNGDSQRLSRSFYLNGQVSQFLIQADLFSEDGRYGLSKRILVSIKEVYAQLTLPYTILIDDDLDIPITVANNKAESQIIEVQILEKYSDYSETTSRDIALSSESQGQVIFKLNSKKLQYDPWSNYTLDVILLVDGKIVDKATRKSLIEPNGFVIKKTKSGILSEKNGIFWASRMSNSLQTIPIFTAEVYSSTISVLLAGIQSFNFVPVGCFEQVSASLYPVIMSLQYIREIEDRVVGESSI